MSMRLLERVLGLIVFLGVAAMLSLTAHFGAQEIYRQEIEEASKRAESYQLMAEHLAEELEQAHEVIEQYERLLRELEPIASGIASSNPRINPWPVAYQVLESAKRYGVEPMLVVALGKAESDWHLNASGRYGEYGPMQIMPATFRALGGKNPSDWRENIDLGTKYLAMMLERAKGNVQLAVAYYNAGPSRPSSTVMRVARNHVSRVMAIHASL